MLRCRAVECQQLYNRVSDSAASQFLVCRVYDFIAASCCFIREDLASCHAIAFEFNSCRVTNDSKTHYRGITALFTWFVPIPAVITVSSSNGCLSLFVSVCISLSLSVCVCVCVLISTNRHLCPEKSCNLACTDLLMNSDHELKTRSVWPGLMGLLFMCCQLSVTAHGLSVIRSVVWIFSLMQEVHYR